MERGDPGRDHRVVFIFPDRRESSSLDAAIPMLPAPLRDLLDAREAALVGRHGRRPRLAPV